MGVRLRRRWVIGTLVGLLVVGGVAGAVAMRAAKKNADGADGKGPVTLEFGVSRERMRYYRDTASSRQ